MNNLYVIYQYALKGSHTSIVSGYLPSTKEPETREELENLHELAKSYIADKYEVSHDHVEVVVINWRLLK